MTESLQHWRHVMISSDHITLNDDGTAWLVVSNIGGQVLDKTLDRPCDKCEGDGESRLRWEEPCPDCIDGRHTFDMEAPCQDDGCSGTSLYRVSVIPGMVLPITAWHDSKFGPVWTVGEVTAGVENKARTVTNLPPAAKPGQWAVKLKVAQ